MIHIAIFDITKEGQSLVQGLCDFSIEFPTELQSPIEQICHRFGDAGRSMQISGGPSLRFAPLKEQKYLLSVIERVPADPQQGIPRSYSRIANYVMEQADADELLAVGNWIAAAETLLQLARKTARQQEELLKQGWKAVLGSPASNPVILLGDIAVALMLGGCLRDASKKVRIVQDGANEDYLALEWLMKQLPPVLRRNVRFITNVTMPSEETGLSLSFCTGAAVDSMEKSGNQGGELADLCTFRSGRLVNYRSMQEEAETARTMLEAPSESRYYAGLFLRADDVQTYLTLVQNDWKSPEATLKMLCEVCGEKAAVVFLTHGGHGYTPGMLSAFLKTKPKWLKNYPTLSGYLKKQFSVPQKAPARTDAPKTAGPEVTVSETTVPAKLKEAPAGKKKPVKSLLVLGGLALVALLGILLVFFGAFDFIAAEEAILLTVEAQVYVIRMVCTIVFTMLFTLFFGLLLLLVAVRIRKNK